jgi:hypothetical protein
MTSGGSIMPGTASDRISNFKNFRDFENIFDGHLKK